MMVLGGLIHQSQHDGGSAYGIPSALVIDYMFYTYKLNGALEHIGALLI